MRVASLAASLRGPSEVLLQEECLGLRVRSLEVLSRSVA